MITAVHSLDVEVDVLHDLANNTANDSDVHIVECDTSFMPSIRAFAEYTKTIIDQPGSRVDVLTNNAGTNAVPEQTVISCTFLDGTITSKLTSLDQRSLLVILSLSWRGE